MQVLRPGRLAVAAAALVVLAAPSVARADAVTDWSVHASTAILATGPTAHDSTLSFAIVHGAMYDAVNAIDGGYQPYLSNPDATPFDSQHAAAATAAFRVLKWLYPTQVLSPTLESRYDASLAAIPDGAAKLGGIAAGETAAAAMIAARTNDGRNGPPFVAPPTPQPPGKWRLSPPAFAGDPQWWVGNVTPFLVPSAEMLRTDGPQALTSRHYAKDFNEVKRLGSLTSTGRTADQTMAAIFWQAQPLGVYGALMRSFSTRFGLTTAENARMFAMVATASADAAIGCWNDKYYWNFWRPVDAIRLADTDGNPETEADPNWLPLFDPSTPTTPTLFTPGFPEHPSGHSCVSGAIMYTLKDFFDSNEIAFDVASLRFPGKVRHYESFSELVGEIIDCRVWGGIHFRTADRQGAELGRDVAKWLHRHYFKPVR
jgi:hypothetical protein